MTQPAKAWVCTRGVGRMSNRAQNERKYGAWVELPVGGRRYRLEIEGRLGWRAAYFKLVDSEERTLRFWQEIYDENGKLVEIHEKFPENKGHRKVE